MDPGVELAGFGVWHHRKGLVEDWDGIVASHVLAWEAFDVDERVELSEIANWLLKHKHWEAAHGFELNEEILTTISFLASVPVLGLGVDYYREVSAIIMYPTTVVSRGTPSGHQPGTFGHHHLPWSPAAQAMQL